MIQKTLLTLTMIVAAVASYAADAPTIYGWLRFERNQNDYGVCRFNADAPDNITLLHVFDSDKQACAGAAANGTYYVYRYAPNDGSAEPLDFGAVDLNTGTFTRIADYSRLNTLFSDMTYDYSQQTMYAIGNPGGGSITRLLTVNLSTGEITDLGSLQTKFSTLACSYDGTLYAVRSEDGYLCEINKTTLAVTEIGDTYEIPEEYLQSMEFDHATETLYWAGNNTYEEDFLDTVDLSSGETFRIGYLGTTAQVVGLYIPFVRISADAPAAVTNLKVVADASGALKATLSWINPTATHSGGAVTALTAIKIYRDGTLVATLAGDTTTWTDSTLTESGTVAYTVAAVNASGEGDAAEASAFVGFDVPSAPASTSAVKSGDNSIAVSWTQPIGGKNGGAIELSTLKYRLTRMPDAAVVAENLTETDYTDVVTTRGCYSYKIEAYTAAGTGGSAETNAVKAGPALTVPYTCNFSDDSKFGLWDVVDSNADGYTWKRETTLNAAYYSYNEDGETAGDDWLISSPIRLEEGKMYRLTFKLQSYDVEYPENMDVYLGQNGTVEAMTTKLGDYTVASNTFVPYEVTLPEIEQTGEYYLGFHNHSDAYMFILYLTDVELTEITSGSISGKVTDGTAAIAGVKVSLDGSDSTVTTDAAGTFLFDNVSTGEHTLSFTADGYAEKTITVDVTNGSTIAIDVQLTKVMEVSVSGVVLTQTGKVVGGAKVELKGYKNYSSVSGNDGTFSLPSVLTDGTGELIVSHRELETKQLEVQLTDAVNALGNIVLTPRIVTPTDVKVTTADNAIINWTKPVAYENYRVDSGDYDGRIGNPNGTATSVYGNVMRTPARLYGINWYTDKYLQEHSSVNIFVFDLDSDGNPTSTTLYQKENVQNIDNQWNTLTFDTPIDAPNGYMLAISATGHAGLGLAAESADYPFAERTTCYSDDYTTGSFSYVEDHNINRQAMIRAIGIDSDKLNIPSVLDCTYKAWRLKDTDAADEAAWTLLTAAELTATTFTDANWSALTAGIYRFAVKAVYSDGRLSDAALSDKVYKNMTTDVTISLTTDTPTNEALGANVTLTGKTPEGEAAVYSAVADAQGQVSFTDVWKGEYEVSATKHGFNALTATADLSTDELHSLEYTLREYVIDPFALEIKKSDSEDTRIFNWNTAHFLFDDFESHTAFTINSPGTIGWTYIDDSNTETLPIDGVDYAHAGEQMAFQVFNPYETDPVLGVLNSDIRPHSGNQFLASFAKANASVYNNDFIISPQLDFSDDFVLRFYAKSCNEDYGQEKMNAGYSTTGNAATDFTWLNGDSPVELPMGDWKEYRYTVPADAKYVAINCVSDYLFVMMLDDVFIGTEMPDGVDPDAIRNDVVYEVYLDGKKVAETSTPAFTFTNLLYGTHRAGVRAVYHSTTTKLIEKEFVVELTEAGIEAPNALDCKVYPNPTSGLLRIDGTYQSAEVTSASGSVVARIAQGETLNISNCPDGIYFVRILNGNSSTVKKVILKK